MTLKKAIISSAVCAVFSLHVNNTVADQIYNDDVIVSASLCVGIDCTNGEAFNFDTIRLKENNLRIRFQDSSNSGSFPTADWQLTANDSGNGGANYFAIEDIDAGTVPFRVMHNAGNNSLYVAASGNVGFGTSTPIVDLNVKSGNSPTLRLEQDATSGFAEQAWDVGANETNFFVRDVTNSSRIPFKIIPGAPHNSFFIANDGDVGLETSTPDGLFDIAHPSNANNHAVLVDPTGQFGINVDNGYMPAGLFDVQTTGGSSKFTVQSDGDVGIGTSTPSGRFEVRSSDAINTYFNIDSAGRVGVGSNATTSLFSITDDISDLTPSLLLKNENTNNEHAVLLSLQNNDNSYIEFVNTASSPTVEKWYVGSREDGDFTITHTNQRIFELDSAGNLTVIGTVSGGSSVTLKENISLINPNAILEKLSRLNISHWNYITDDDSVKHIGPLSEDFHDMFGLNGEEKERISYNDLAGVSLAAIKALIEKNNELEKQVNELKKLYKN